LESWRDVIKLVHKFKLLPPDKRPQDPYLDGRGLLFETLDHGGEYPDAMPQTIRVTDALGRSCLYVPTSQDGRVVDGQGFDLDPDDD
jgi:hypothetical protein